MKIESCKGPILPSVRPSFNFYQLAEHFQEICHMISQFTAQSPRRNRWILWTACLVFGVVMLFMLSMQFAAQRRYAAAFSRLERTNAPMSVDDLAAQEMVSRNAAEARLALAYPKLDAIDARLFQLYDDDGMTAEGQAEIEDVFLKHSGLLAEILDCSESKAYWSRRRYDQFRGIDPEAAAQLSKHARTVARYLQHVSSYAHRQGDSSTAVRSATAILRLSNLLASQPLTEQCHVCYVLRGMSLSLLQRELKVRPLDESEIREVEDVLVKVDATATFVAMLETERAVRISEYEHYGSRLFFRVNAMVDLLDFFEKRTLPIGVIGKISMGNQYGDFVTDVKALDSTRTQLRDQERNVLDLFERARQ